MSAPALPSPWNETPPRERDAWVAEWVMGKCELCDGTGRVQREYGTVPCYLCHGGEKSYTTDPAADYEVLVKVRETWGKVWGNAEKWWQFASDIGLDAWDYEPGDYSEAAYRALTGDDR